MRIPSPIERFSRTQRLMTLGAAGGRTGVVSPEPRPLQKPETIPESIFHRYATIVVAAADSPATAQEVDFKCTGTDDHLVVQAAVDYSLTLDFQNPRILLLAGTYNFGDSVALNTFAFGVSIEGEGASLINVGGTVIKCGGSAGTIDAFVINYEGTTIKNLVIQHCDLGIEAKAGGWIIENVMFENVKRPIVLTQASSTYVWYGCRIKDVTFGNSCGNGAGSYMIDLNWTNANSIEGLSIRGIQFPGLFASSSGTLRLKTTGGGHGNGIHIDGNEFKDDLLFDGFSGTLMLGPNSWDFTDVEIRNAEDVTMIGNNGIDNLTLHTINQFAHGGNIVNGTYTETAVTTKAGVSIGIT